MQETELTRAGRTHPSSKLYLRYLSAFICMSFWVTPPLFGASDREKHLFVLQRTRGALVEYAPTDFRELRSVKLPDEAFNEVFKPHGEINVNGSGQVLMSIYPPHQGLRPLEYWFGNGQKSQIIPPEASLYRDDDYDQDGYGLPRPLLSADGKSLFWFETAMKVRRQIDRGGYQVPEVEAVFQVMQSDLKDGKKIPILKNVLPPCICETGVCTETCAVGRLWSPSGIIDDFFFVTYWVPGQIGSTFQSTYLFQKDKDIWAGKKLDRPCEAILDARNHGTMLVETVPDGGCCGWENESNDLTYIRYRGLRTEIFDEGKKYDNFVYDVSFFSANAHISPDLSMIAHTIASTMPEDANADQFRFSSSVEQNREIRPEEVSRLRQMINRHPVVEILAPGASVRKLAEIEKATLIGWLNEREGLIFREEKLAVINVHGGKQVNILPITAEKAEDVFLR
ncbi:MAG: hypothetical protein C0390_04985 [Syntrophus sp. (in: bacteria)]|nr:hypothetical protein [Syntrophus sp. (in: bacteria)]